MTVTLLTMWDAAYPDSTDPDTAAELVYAGGDTPNPQSVVTGKARYRVPCWVRSNPSAVDPSAEANAFLAWLVAHQVPHGVYVWLDLETAVDSAWVTTFGAVMRAGGYLVSPYGSYDAVIQNPVLDGYATAHYTGNPHICAKPVCGADVVGAVATQYANSTMLGTTYDLSEVAATPLWDTEADMPLTAADEPIIEAAIAAATPALVEAIQLMMRQEFGGATAELFGRIEQADNASEAQTQAGLVNAISAAVETAVAAAIAKLPPPSPLKGETATETITFD